MASPEYHRRQADLLIKTANATRVSRTAAALKERAMEQIWLAEVAESMARQANASLLPLIAFDQPRGCTPPPASACPNRRSLSAGEQSRRCLLRWWRRPCGGRARCSEAVRLGHTNHAFGCQCRHP